MPISQPSTQLSHGPLQDLAESEIVVALFRTLVIMLVALVPRLTEQQHVYSTAEIAFLVGAAVYNLVTAVLYWRRLRFRYQRQIMLCLDLALVTICIHLGALPRNQLFPLYFLVTIVAAIWFKVVGALIVATLASSVHLYLLATAALPSTEQLHALTQSLSLNLPFLYLIALLAGYLAESQEHERSNLVDARALIDQYENEMRFSRQIQRLLLAGPVPETPGVQLGWRVQPARVSAGGDYFDVLALPDDRLGLCIADVAGKSLDAQIRLPLLKYALRAVAPEASSPAAVVTRLNALVYPDLQPDMYIGLCYAVLDTHTGRLTYCNAGHTAPLVVSAEQGVRAELNTLGPALGVADDWTYEEAEAQLKREEVLILFTDGLLDARDPDGAAFGEEELRELATRSASLPARHLANTLVDTVNEFEHGRKRDDLTVLVAKRVAEGA